MDAIVPSLLNVYKKSEKLNNWYFSNRLIYIMRKPHFRIDHESVQEHFLACTTLANQARAFRTKDKVTKTLLETMMQNCESAKDSLYHKHNIDKESKDKINDCYKLVGALSYAYSNLSKLHHDP